MVALWRTTPTSLQSPISCNFSFRLSSLVHYPHLLYFNQKNNIHTIHFFNTVTLTHNIQYMVKTQKLLKASSLFTTLSRVNTRIATQHIHFYNSTTHSFSKIQKSYERVSEKYQLRWSRILLVDRRWLPGLCDGCKRENFYRR